MSAPAHSRPFDLANAKAGAPIGNRHGDDAHFVAHVPEAVSQSRVIVRFKSGEIGTRRENGKHYEGGEQTPGDLVMRPLGLIDGKPVFVGDEIELKCFAPPQEWKRVKAEAGWTGTWTDNGQYARWPAPPKMYPETLMGDDDLRHAAGMNHNNMTMTVRHLHSAANAALRHAVDAGQVVVVDWDVPARAARDMAIAQAVRRACVEAFDPAAMLARDWSEAMGNLNLSAIIAAIK